MGGPRTGVCLVLGGFVVVGRALLVMVGSELVRLLTGRAITVIDLSTLSPAGRGAVRYVV